MRARRHLVPPALALLIATGWSLPASADPETGADPTADNPAPVQREVLTAARDRDGVHVILSSGSDGSFAVHMGSSTNPKELKVLAINRNAPNFHVDTLEMGEIVFNSVDQTAIIRGEVGFNAKKPTRTFTLRPKQIAVRRALGEVPPRIAAVKKADGGDNRLRAQTSRADPKNARASRRPGWLGSSRRTPTRDARRGASGSSTTDGQQPKNRVRKARRVR